MENRMQDQEEMMNSLRKELKLTRYCSLFVAVLLVVVIIGGVSIVNILRPAVTAVQEMQPVMEEMAQLDVAMLNEKIAQLDIDGLNQAIAGLDTEEMSEALANINDAVEKLQALGEGFQNFSGSMNQSISSLFGGSN